MKKFNLKSKIKNLPVDGKPNSTEAPETPKDTLALRAGNLFLGYLGKNPKTAEQKAVLKSLQNNPLANAVRKDDIVFPADPLASVLISTTKRGTAPRPAPSTTPIKGK